MPPRSRSIAVEFDPTENLATVLRRYRAGEFDIAYGVPNDQLGWLKQNMPKELHLVPLPAVIMYVFNTTKPPLNDRRVRQALAMAIDREVLVEKVTRGGELPAYGYIPDGIANYISQKVSWAKMNQADRDVAAISLMSEAGYGPRKPLNLRLTYTASFSGTNSTQLAVAIAAMWKKLGVNVELVNVESKVRLANMRQGDFEVAHGGWSADYNDALEFLFLFQTSTKSQNFPRFFNADYDRLMDAAAVTGDQSKRAQLLGQAEQVLLRELPILPIYFGVARHLVSTRVKGWEDNLQNRTYVKNLSFEK
jgi:oligopeptide transport system substrate-binding protein